MNDLISRSTLLENIEKSRKAHASVRSRLTVGDMEQMINGARPVDAEVVRHGIPVAHYETWCNSDGEPVTTLPYGYECPFCGDADIKKYCPNCGAKMDGDNNETD